MRKRDVSMLQVMSQWVDELEDGGVEVLNAMFLQIPQMMEEYFLVLLSVAERYVSTMLVPLAYLQAIDDVHLTDDLPYRLGCC